MFDRILVPLDGSDVAESIFPSLLPLAQELGSDLLLLSVIEHGNESEAEARTAREEARGSVRTLERSVTGIKASGIKEYLAGVEGYLAKRGVIATATCVYGKVAPEILVQGDAMGCDLIAMSTRGRSGLGRGILGSVTDEVVRTSHIPVLVYRPSRRGDAGRGPDISGPEISGSELKSELKKVVVPLDGSELAEVVLPLVEGLAREFLLEVALVRVVRFAPIAYSAMEPLPMDRVDVQASLVAEAEAYLDEVKARLESKGIRATATVMEGVPGRRIIDYAGGSEGTMAAVSTHGRSGLSRIVLGSVADELIKGMDIPVLVVRPDMAKCGNTG